jgi:threonine/homoserine/homoserine lactone efflux protein
MAVACGAALGESVYAFAAYLGTGALFVAHPGVAGAGRVAAAMLPIALGISFLVRRGEGRPAAADRIEGNFLLGLAISGLNPTLVATWTVVAGAVHAFGGAAGGVVDAVLFAAGVAGGGVLWAWLMLRFLSRHKGRFSPRAVGRLVRVVGVVLIAFGLWSAISLVGR